MLVPIFYCIKNQPPAPLSLLFRKKSRSARCRYQLFVNSSVQLPPPKCQKCLFHVSFTGRRKLRGHESHPKWVGFFMPFTSKKLTPIDKRLANTPSQHGFVRCRFLWTRAVPCARFVAREDLKFGGFLHNTMGFTPSIPP